MNFRVERILNITTAMTTTTTVTNLNVKVRIPKLKRKPELIINAVTLPNCYNVIVALDFSLESPRVLAFFLKNMFIELIRIS